MGVRTFDPSKTIVVVNGIPLGGLADGSSIKVSRSSDMFKKVTGMDGYTSRAKSSDRSGEITITLAQTSPSNDVLSALVLLDETKSKGVVSVAIRDLSGRSVYGTAKAWIRKHTDVEFGKEIGNRDWVFDCAFMAMFTGGNIES